MMAMAVMAMIRLDKGFTLTELAVVLVIVSLLMGGLLIPLGAQQEIEKRRATEQQLNNIRETLIAFGTVNMRLPCPDTNNDGLECAMYRKCRAGRRLALENHGDCRTRRLGRQLALPN